MKKMMQTTRNNARHTTTDRALYDEMNAWENRRAAIKELSTLFGKNATLEDALGYANQIIGNVLNDIRILAVAEIDSMPGI